MNKGNVYPIKMLEIIGGLGWRGGEWNMALYCSLGLTFFFPMVISYF
jgi:hypothetical protein